MTLDELLVKVKESADRIEDYTCVAEGYSSAGAKEGHRTTEFRYKRAPEMVYGKVVGNRSNYRSRSTPGSKFALRGGRLEARLGGVLGLIKFTAKPDDKMARWLRGERVDQSHVPFIAAAMLQAAKEGRMSLEGTENVDGKEMYKLKTTGFDPKTHFGVSEERVWIDPDVFLPLKVAKYEAGNPRPVSSWRVKNFKMNVGLKAKDFVI